MCTFLRASKEFLPKCLLKKIPMCRICGMACMYVSMYVSEHDKYAEICVRKIEDETRVSCMHAHMYVSMYLCMCMIIEDETVV